MNCDLIKKKKSCSIHFDDLSVDDNTLNYYCCERCVDLCTSNLQSSFSYRCPLPTKHSHSPSRLYFFKQFILSQNCGSVSCCRKLWTQVLVITLEGYKKNWGPNIVCMFIVYIDRGNAIYFCTSMK